MQRRVVGLVGGAASMVVLTAMLTSTARAQPAPLGNSGSGGSNLRDRYEKPRQQQKLDDAIRKFGEEDVQTRLEGVEGLGENAEDPKAIEYLLRGAADADLSVRVKSIDVVGNARLKQAVPLLVQQLEDALEVPRHPRQTLRSFQWAYTVIPTKAGIQSRNTCGQSLDARFRGHDTYVSMQNRP